MLYWFSGCLLLSAILAYLIYRPARERRRATFLQTARRDFHHQREHLEARFFELAGKTGKPRGLRWSNCDFSDDVVYARDRHTDELNAFVSVEIGFEAIAGGGMEDVEAVSNIRAATAVFTHRAGQWRTDGRAVFNLNPAQAVQHFRQSLELVEERR
jgi:hypothetical protein